MQEPFPFDKKSITLYSSNVQMSIIKYLYTERLDVYLYHTRNARYARHD